MLAHSILQEGPGMQTLANYVYEFLVHRDKETSVAVISLEDLPYTSQNVDLIEFLKKVSNQKFFEKFSEIL